MTKSDTDHPADPLVPTDSDSDAPGRGTDNTDRSVDRAETTSDSPAERISTNRRGFFRQIFAFGIEQAEKATHRFDQALEQLADSNTEPHVTPPEAGDPEPDEAESAHKPPDMDLTPPENTQPRD